MRKSVTHHTRRKPMAATPKAHSVAGKRRSPAKARKKQPVLTSWEGVTLSISYDPHWLALANSTTAHIEVHVIQPVGIPLPITDTGYRSHFVAREAVEATGGPVAYVTSCLGAEGRSPSYRRALERWRQLSLLDLLQAGE